VVALDGRRVARVALAPDAGDPPLVSVKQRADEPRLVQM